MQIHNLKKYKNIRKVLRKNMTKGECVLWMSIQKNQLEYKFRRQHSIGPYIVDFYCPRLRLVVEIDGGTRDDPEILIRDNKKQEYLEGLKFYIKRYDNYEVLNDLDGVWQNLYDTCEFIYQKKIKKHVPPS